MVDIGDTLTWNGVNWQNANGSSDDANDAQPPNVFVTDPNNPGAPEPWHALTPLHGWTNSSGNPASVRLVASPPNSVQIVLNFSAVGATVADGTIIAQLPTSPFDGSGMQTYTPLTNKLLPCRCDALKVSGSTFEAAGILIQAGTGQIQCFGVGTAATFLGLTAVYPVDI